jgi:hypothetical protein
MKIKIYIIVASIIVASAFAAEYSMVNQILDNLEGQPHKEVFKAYHYLFNKKYNLNSQEGLNRYRIFKQNLLWDKAENKKRGKIIHRFTKFSDLTLEEYNQQMLMKPEIMKKHLTSFKKNSVKFVDGEEVDEDNDEHMSVWFGDYPKKEKKQQNEVKNFFYSTQEDINHMQWEPKIKEQGKCGSCWAFAALGAIANQYHKLTGTLTDFSEQYLVDCDNLDYGCNGGYPTKTLSWITDNGIVGAETLNYTGIKGVCDEKLDLWEYQIVDGFKVNSITVSFEQLLKKGPLIVGMDAKFRGFMTYRPIKFDPIIPGYCRCANHAVVAVGLITENEQRYIIGRNSWGEDWGHKGYFKIPFDQSCKMSEWGWLPSVYQGHVPDGKTLPKNPKCVQLTGKSGFQEVITETCESLPIVPTGEFSGIKFQEHRRGTNIELFVYDVPNCQSDRLKYLNDSKEFLGFSAKSLAYKKYATYKCADLYYGYCFLGPVEFTLCGDVSDTTQDLTKFQNVKSIIAREIRFIHFYTEPNFTGKKYSRHAYHGFSLSGDLETSMRDGKIKSIKMEYY